VAVFDHEQPDVFMNGERTGIRFDAGAFRLLNAAGFHRIDDSCVFAHRSPPMETHEYVLSGLFYPNAEDKIYSKVVRFNDSLQFLSSLQSA